MTVPGNLSSPLLATAAAAAAAGGIATKSLRFDDGDSAYLSKTPSSAGNQKTFTISFWVKRVKSGAYNPLIDARSPLNDSLVSLLFDSNDNFQLGHYSFSSIITSRVYRDFSSFYHIVLAVDTTQATASNRIKLYTNGVQETAFSTATYPAQNTTYNWNSASLHTINQAGTGYGGQYFADIYNIDGSQLDCTSFGAFDSNGVWQAAAYSGTFGTNGFHLNFADGSDLGADVSGNSNSFTANNLVGSTAGADVSIANATGALPIRNTTGTYGGTVASGNRTDSLSGSLQLAMPLRADLSDVSGNSYTITNTGVTFTTDHSKFYGQSAAFFDSDKVVISNATGLGQFGTGNFTIEAYVKFTDNGHYYGRLIEFGSVNSNAFVIDGTTAPFRLRYDAGSTTVYGTTGTIPLGKWTHVAVVRNSGTLKFYVDGVEGGSHSFTHSLSGDSAQIGNYLGSQLDFDGYIQDLRVYGAAKYTSNFTPPNNPTNGLPGRDLDLLFDVPTNGDQSDTGAGGEVSGGYCVLNPLAVSGTLSQGNLQGQCPVGSSQHASFAIPASGKWYFEAEMTNSGILNLGLAAHKPAGHIYQNSNSVLYSTSGVKNVDGVTDQSYGATWTLGDIIGCACDADAGTITFYKNNSSQGALSHQIAGLFPSFGNGGVATNYAVNFGQRPFAYTAPTGFKCLNTSSLPTPTIADGSDYFETVLYSGNQTAKSITTGHASDFVWLKVRNQGNNHFLFDSVRGVGRRLMTSGNNDEDGDSSTDTLTSFNSDGFSIGADTATGGVNANSAQMVAWSWVAASSTASNTDGDVTSSVRANQTAGFSIVKWTNNGNNTPSSHRWGHGLGVVPDLVIVKRINNTSDWNVYSEVFNNPVRDEIYLNTTAAKHTSGSDLYHRDSTTVGIRAGSIGSSGDQHIAYCFASVAGYSRVGKYEGNSARNFQYLGFQPRWIMIKTVSITAYPAYTGWAIFDTERPPAYNVNVNSLFANNTNQEGKRGNNSTASAPDFGVDILSNGFCLRDNGASEINLNGETYIYLAFASNPFQANGGLAR